MNEDIAYRLLRAAPRTIVFSIDSSDPQIYARIRQGATLEKVLRRLEIFNSVRAHHYADTKTRTRIHTVVTDPGQDTAHDRDFWRGWADEYSVRQAMPRTRIYEDLTSSNARPCSLLWERLYVWWDGTVTLCDTDYLSMLALGKVDPKEEGVRAATLRMAPRPQALRWCPARTPHRTHDGLVPGVCLLASTDAGLPPVWRLPRSRLTPASANDERTIPDGQPRSSDGDTPDRVVCAPMRA
jgi:hypothetical protein